MVPCPWCVIPGAWILVHGLVRDPWCMMPCLWCVIPGARSVVPGAWIPLPGAWCLVPGAWILVHGALSLVYQEVGLSHIPDFGGLAGCQPMHHGGSGWCAMGASLNAFSSHPMDVWSVFPWHGGDSRESSLEPNPGQSHVGKVGSREHRPRCTEAVGATRSARKDVVLGDAFTG
ncbi:hypothetical protein RIF29_15130 [Crotalaria pallida]|uniref:Uncharacterized protein n=1 Tax=Crotalaria pallida TaxID=3830 RepID=A0AAN9IDC3_CROPI